jgi:hypothetical protein
MGADGDGGGGPNALDALEFCECVARFLNFGPKELELPALAQWLNLDEVVRTGELSVQLGVVALTTWPGKASLNCNVSCKIIKTVQHKAPHSKVELVQTPGRSQTSAAAVHTLEMLHPL